MTDGDMPRLMTARLIRQNRKGGRRLHWREFVLPGIGILLWVCAWRWRDLLGLSVAWLQGHVLIVSALTAIVTAFAIARRRDLQRAELSRSWLAALPIRPRAARWEMLRIEMLPATAAVAAFTFAFVVVASVCVLAPDRQGAPPQLWACFCGAVLLGAIGSFAIRTPKPIDMQPGSRYVPKQRVMKGRPIRPSLAALGRWPVRQMFAQAQPKLVARATLPVLLSMGMGSTADTAMVALGLLAASGALALLIPAAISASVVVAGWMAPLPIGMQAVLRALLGRALAVILGASLLDGFFAAVLGASYRAAALAALWIAVTSTAAMLIGVWLRQMRRPWRT
jgi:hypothetical protein